MLDVAAWVHFAGNRPKARDDRDPASPASGRLLTTSALHPQFTWVPIRLRDASSISVLDDLRRIVQALRRSSRAAEQSLGVTGAQLYVLQTLCTGPAVSLNDLADATHTDQSTVSVVVRRLVDRGFVRRHTSPTDARRLVLEPSESGRALLARAPAASQEHLIDALQSLPTAQRRSLAVGLRALTTRMRLNDGAPAMFFEDEKVRAKRGGRRVR